jgi:hypothetical protein
MRVTGLDNCDRIENRTFSTESIDSGCLAADPALVPSLRLEPLALRLHQALDAHQALLETALCLVEASN